MSMQFQCCFCAKQIDSGGLGIGSLLYTTNWDGEEAEQQTQQFSCHADCLRASFHPSTPVNALEDLG
jgi:hypothetical protein